MDKYFELPFDENEQYIIPFSFKPVKVVYNELPCPIVDNVRCKMSKSDYNGTKLTIYCSAEKCIYFE